MNGLKQKRKERGLTLKDVAVEVGVGQAAISLWERGKRFPRKDALNKLCELFSCKIDDLI